MRPARSAPAIARVAERSPDAGDRRDPVVAEGARALRATVKSKAIPVLNLGCPRGRRFA
jgi:hypothetical protein